jgi:NTE family protein
LGPLDWKTFDRTIALGYAHAKAMIEKNGVPLTERWSDGPAAATPQHGDAER